MEKLMLLVPKIWQEESYLLLEISFLLAEGVFYKLRDKERSKESAYVLVAFCFPLN